MNIEEFREYCLSKKGTTEGFPFGPEVLVFKVMGKMFSMTAMDRVPFQVNLKNDPEKSIELRETYDGIVVPGYHMSKKHWNTVFLGNLPPKIAMELIDDSYNLVVAGLTKKLKAELNAL